MYTLALDTTGYKIHLVLLKNDRVVFERDWRSNMNEDETITKTIQHINELEPFFAQKLTKVIVNEGPGTLTGTRVGVAMANALASAVKAPMVKLTSHDIWPMRLRDEDRALKPHFLLRITENELYVDGTIMELKDAVKMITKEAGKGKKKGSGFLAFGELTPTQFSLLNKIKGFTWIIETDLLSFAKTVERIVDKGDRKLAVPRYARPPVITESKKKQLVPPVKLDSLPDFVPPPHKKAEKLIVKQPAPKKVVLKKAAPIKSPAKVKAKAPAKKILKKVAPKKKAVKKPAPRKAATKKPVQKKSFLKRFANKIKKFAKKKVSSKKKR